MKKEMKKVPAIRFKGFTDDWEQRKLGELATFNKGAGYSKSDLKASGTQIILYGRLYTKYETVIKQVDTFVDSRPGSVYSEGGEVIVPASGETAEDIAIASVVEKPGILLGGDLNIIHPIRNLDSTFLAISISNGEPHKEMAKRAQGKSVVHLHNDDLSQIKFRYPSIEEQSKISKFFSNLDNLITLHQRKSDQLKKMKAYFLQNLFPAKGEKVPKIRFKGFTGEWEERKLGDICKVSSGIMGDSKLNNGTYHLTKIETISDGFVDENRVGYLNQKPDESFRLQKGDILYSNINSISHIGKVAKYEGHSLLYHGINLLRLTPSEETDSDFLLYFLNTKGKKNWARSHANPAVNQASINKTLLETQEIMVCDMEEQKKIGAFFSIIKNHLILHQQKITQLQAVKKFLLQNLFV